MTAAKETTENSTRELFALYEKGMTCLHSGKYQEALAIFDQMEQAFPGELDVLARTRDFRKLCERKLKERNPRKVNGDDVNECYDMGIFLHNSERYEEALDAFRQACSLAESDLPFLHYAIAASNARLGRSDEALQHLEKAIRLAPENRYAAYNDPDFSPLAVEGGFKVLLANDL